MVDSMKQSFLLKPEVLTPNRNGFMAKKRKWHLKAGSTVYARVSYGDCIYTYSRERSYSLHLANGGMERCSCWQRLPTSKVCHAQKDHVHLKLKS